MKVVAVTGATGFVGSRLCERLIDDGWQVRRALRRAGTAEGVVVGDLGSEMDWSGAVTGVDAVVHLAARVHVMQDQASDPLAEFRWVNVEGTLNLARQAAEAGVRRFVYLSSIKVNGEGTGPRPSGRDEGRVTRDAKEKYSSELKVLSAERTKAFREEDVPDPQDAYAISKWEAEQGLMALARETGMELVIIRPPLVYGPGVKGNFAFMLRWVKKGVPLPLGAVQDNRRSFVALDNLVGLIVTCLDHPKAANEVFLVSDGEDLSTRELLRRIARAYGKSSRLIPVPVGIMRFVAWLMGKQGVADRLFGSLQVDSSKAQNLLGWEPVVTMEQQLEKIVNHESEVVNRKS